MREPQKKAGYTLLEVMISMLILAIAFLALIAVQLGALNGYVSARDNTTATEVAERTADLIRLQGLQWTAAGPFTNTTAQTIYDGAGDTPFDDNDPLRSMLTPAGAWVTLVQAPVDARFGRKGMSTGAAHLGGKYCIYARGNPMTGSALGNGAVQVQIAVVYPGPTATLNACANAQVTNVLGTVGSAGNPPPLESTLGLRVIYHGTTVLRRSST